MNIPSDDAPVFGPPIREPRYVLASHTLVEHWRELGRIPWEHSSPVCLYVDNSYAFRFDTLSAPGAPELLSPLNLRGGEGVMNPAWKHAKYELVRWWGADDLTPRGCRYTAVELPHD